MTGMTNYSADNWLQYIVGETAMPALPTAYVALFVGVGTDAGTGFTEVTGSGYARLPTTSGQWAAASGTSPSTITNNTTFTFATAGAPWGTVIAIGLYDASGTGSGNLLTWDYLGNYQWLPTTISNASPAVFTAHANGYASGDSVIYSTEYGGTSPTVASGSLSGILSVASPATDTFTVVNNTSGVFTTSTGNGMVRKVTQQVISQNVTTFFASGALILSAA